MTHLRFAAALAATLAAGPAMAEDWTGVSVGVQAGYLDLTGDDGMGDVENESGGTAGLRLYYDQDFGNFVVGGGLQYDTMNIDVDGTAVESLARVGARAGWDMGNAWIYGTGGWANLGTDNPGVGSSDGYFVGIGTEFWLSGNMTAGAEVLFHEFNDFEDPNAMVDVTTVGLSLNWRF